MIWLAYIAIGVFAILPIYTGSQAALRRPVNTPKVSPEEDDDENSFTVPESLSTTDAMLFPVLGGFVLGAMYLIITYVSKDWLSYFMSLYFVIIGIPANMQTIYTIVCYMFPQVSSAQSYQVRILSFACPKLTVLQIFAAIMSIMLSTYYYLTKSWIASNCIGLSFSFSGIQLITLDSFLTGAILLSGLFIYDIYFVFGTHIMETVAKNINAPMMIRFPKDLLNEANGPATMLGLGDIVIPGTYIALCLRYDLYEYHNSHPGMKFIRKNFTFPKPYFTCALGAYMLALTMTIWVMHYMHAAQPALLYISPACILSTVILAWQRDEIASVWSYSEDSSRNDARLSLRDDEKQK